MTSVWDTLPKPFLALAPMEDVTDTVFRRVVASCGRPDIFFTEFTNVDGLASAGSDIVSQRLQFTDSEHPIIAQIWGVKPQNFYTAAQQIVRRGFDGIDINMGCPVKDVVSHGACAALIDNPNLAKEIVSATKQGAGKLPVSVKTRLGVNTIQTEGWIPFLLEQGLAALTIHGRTAKEMSSVPAHWDEIGKAVSLRDQLGVKTFIIGNGDVKSSAEATEKVKTYKVDGVMIGRGVFDNLWVFDRSGNRHEPSKKERLALLLGHVRLFDQTWGKTKNFAILKKYFKIYVRDFDGASDLRARLMTATTATEIETVVVSWL